MLRVSRIGVPAYAVGLGAYLSLADLQTAVDTTPDDRRYLILGSIGIAGLVVCAGWHALWLLPAGAIGFAWIYETYFWTAPPGVGQGMDDIGFHPTGVMWVMLFAVPFAGLLAGVREAVLTRVARAG